MRVENVTESDLLIKIRERQTLILCSLQKYGLVLLVLSFLGLAGTGILAYYNGDSSSDIVKIIKSTPASLTGLLSITFTLMANMIIWYFVVLSLTFVPFVAWKANNISAKVAIPISSRSMKWLQLYFSTLLPLVIFAIIWLSLPDSAQTAILKLPTIGEIPYVLVGGAVICGFLWLLLSLVPKRLVTVHLTSLSMIFYATLLLAFGVGYNSVAYSTMLGTLFFLTFSFPGIEDIGKRIAIYDVDNDLIEEIATLTRDQHKIRLEEDKFAVRKKVNEHERRKLEIKYEQDNLENVDRLNRKEIDFTKNIQTTAINTITHKADTLNQMLSVLSDEMHAKIKSEIDAKLIEFEENAKDKDINELQDTMLNLYKQMDSTLNLIPERLKDLRKEMKKVIAQGKKETLLLTKDSEKET